MSLQYFKAEVIAAFSISRTKVQVGLIRAFGICFTFLTIAASHIVC